MEEQWGEKMNIYFDSLSPYYMFSVGFSIFAILFSWWYSKQCHREMKNTIKKSEASTKIDNNVTEDSDDNSDVVDDELANDLNAENMPDTLQSRIKVAKHQAIVNKMTANMTAEQMMEEKETEKAQLAAIYNLLKEQQEKFHVSDMQELQEQLSLYR